MFTLLVEPRDLEIKFFTPVRPMIERTVPPAIIPVPGAAGFINTSAPVTLVRVSWQIVSPSMLKVIMVFLALEVALFTAVVTSLPLATPIPTLFLWLPIATRALNLILRPPATVRDTRSIAMVISSNSFGPVSAFTLSRRFLRSIFLPEISLACLVAAILSSILRVPDLLITLGALLASSAILKLQSFLAGGFSESIHPACI